MNEYIPNFVYKEFLEQYGDEITSKIIEGYSLKRSVTLRVNTLKNNVNNVKAILESHNFKFKDVSWYKDALIIENADESEIKKLDLYNNGEIYLQSLSSMLPAIILNAKENENILDMTAAPGGKTTQISALSNNTALITACEKNKIRSERLKYNINKQGANRVNILVEDARNLDSYFSFDKILLDAPCSGSGTINIYDNKLNTYFNEELVKRSQKLQYELLRKAISILKSNGELVYSTCSILKSENEDNIFKILNDDNVELIPIDNKKLQDIPLLPVSIDGTICVCPNKLFEGFFIAKLKKKK